MFDPFYLAIESIFLLCLLIFIVLFFIPSRKKIQEGEVKSLGSPIVPVLLGISGILLFGFIIFTFLVDYSESLIQLGFIVTWFLLLLPIFVLTVIAYVKARRWVAERSMEHTVIIPEEVPVSTAHGTHATPHAHQQPSHPPSQSVETMEVECPGCGGHLTIPINSHTITCPYCGLSGTL